MNTGTRLEWRTSSYSSNGENCVEVAPSAGWRTSSHSGAGENCVDVAPRDSRVYLRHSKHPSHGTITFDLHAWTAFIDESRSGSRSANGIVNVRKDGADTLVQTADGAIRLRFDDGEWTAFVAGARDGEFDFLPNTN
ncbi:MULTISPECIES: DUF397 domain-containing protein [Nocardia]|uniref:DUF397 domain-containing protein n=4 Tax=Nocardia TaxID=1817 RepID=A0A7G1KFA6_9NOCA|nr:MULTISPECIES: DUF397 domain-containing protein [Nocardia]MBF6445597.1 DUF397 domain-containing protein [Nocardia farcinica]MBF6451921.1 DUF397 domain-containing protein [Nocardia cyriacigeorgica]MBF6477666.1 DUF397 domain-containing protein [Nocardia cyriacigeorgica]MBF6540991.1 DUF397 domain-containing protein [Nocardia farcinica]MBF6549090.1 DUF397 domain-containing protein [Nocardia cyriacigeorgica]